MKRSLFSSSIRSDLLLCNLFCYCNLSLIYLFNLFEIFFTFLFKFQCALTEKRKTKGDSHKYQHWLYFAQSKYEVRRKSGLFFG